MSNKIALVTGANKGIGLETARQLAQKGVQVLLGSRDSAKGEAAAQQLKSEGLKAEALILDVSRRDSLEAAARDIEARFGRLDILVNNAGVALDALDRKPSEQSLAVWRDTFQTNVFGLIETTQVFLPLLHKSTAGRIVNLSSVLGSIADQSDPASSYYDFKIPAYNVSKTAVNSWTAQLAHELRNTAIKVNAVHPGHVQTDMGGANAPVKISDGASTSVWAALLDASGPNGGFFHLAPGQSQPQRPSW